jgi:hypothetical protein
MCASIVNLKVRLAGVGFEAIQLPGESFPVSSAAGIEVSMIISHTDDKSMQVAEQRAQIS